MSRKGKMLGGYIPIDLYRWFVQRAQREHCTVTALLTRLLYEELQRVRERERMTNG